MKVVGIDYSTRAVDLVAIPLDHDANDAPTWTRYDANGATSLDRCRATIAPGRAHSFWDNAALVVIEEPRGQRNVSSPLYRMQGAIVTHVPARCDLWQLTATEWRRELGLRASGKTELLKAESVVEAIRLGAPRHWPVDALEAYLIATAARRMLHRAADKAAA